MKRFVFVLLSIVCLNVLAEENAAQTPAPKLVCDEPVYDFGEKLNTESVEHTFVIKNEGDLSLEIRKVRPSCGCTVAKLSEKIIPPGGTAEIATTLSLKRRRGNQRKTITVESNDPKTPRFILTLSGKAVEGLTAQPAQLFLGRLKSDVVTTGSVEVSIKSGDTFHITSVSGSDSSLGVRVDPIVEGQSYKVVVTTKPPLNEGSLSCVLKVNTDHPTFKEVDIPVSGVVVGDVIVAPREIMINGSEGPAVTRYIVVRSGNDQAFEVSEVVCPDATIQSTVYPMGNNGYRIKLSNIDPKPELDGAMVTLTTSIPDRETIEIPIKLVDGGE